jgi:hypothetical protein
MDFSVFQTDQADQARRERGRRKKDWELSGNTCCRMAPARYTYDESECCFFSLPRPFLCGVPLRPLSRWVPARICAFTEEASYCPKIREPDGMIQSVFFDYLLSIIYCSLPATAYFLIA